MKITDKSEEGIKYSLIQMWQLVARQINDAKISILTYNKDLANEVLIRERMVDNYELQIDKKCEQFTALQNPVAIDLRFVLSHLKMNSSLERIGDLAEGVAGYVVKFQSEAFEEKLLERTGIGTMLDTSLRMLELAYQAYLNDDTSLAMKVITMDHEVDAGYARAMEELADYSVGKEGAVLEEMFYLANVLRRIERIGDRCTNLAENIIFHIDAKELKHSDNIPLFETV